MRTLSSILSLAAALPLLLAVSCHKEGEAVSEGAETAVLSFEVSTLDAQTKSAGTYDPENPPTVEERETIHDDLDIFVFDASTGDLAYQRHHSTDPLTVTAKGKTYNVYAVANMNTRNSSLYSTVTKESDLLSMRVTFGDRDALEDGTQLGAYSYITDRDNDDDEYGIPSHFLMISQKQTISVYTPSVVNLALKRQVSKIRFTGTVSLADKFKEHFAMTLPEVVGHYSESVIFVVEHGPYMSCIPKTFGLYTSGTQAGVDPRYTYATLSTFPKLFGKYDPASFIIDEYWDRLSSGSCYYVCENAAPALTDAQRAADPTATDCCTKLLFLVGVYYDDGDESQLLHCWYYPIAVPNIGRNEVYTIRNVTITGPGSDDPYVYPGDNSNYRSNISYSIEVKDWSTGQLSKIISGGLNQVDEGTSAITI